MFLFKVKVLTTSDNDIFLGVLALLFFYGPAAAGFSYVVSFAFKSPTFCNVLIIIVGFIVSFAGSLATLIMNLLVAVDLGGRKLRLASNIVNWSLRFFPPFNLAKGLLYVLYLNTFALIEQDPDISAFHKDVLLLEVIFLAAEGIVYTAIAIFLDVYLNRPSVTGVFGRALFKNTAVAALGDEDSDVLAEEERVNSGAAADDMIVIKKMSKVYGNGKIAVNSMSLGIHPGECFGLLGINGMFSHRTFNKKDLQCLLVAD
jgi:ABC-2 family transporter protein